MNELVTPVFAIFYRQSFLVRCLFDFI